MHIGIDHDWHTGTFKPCKIPFPGEKALMFCIGFGIYFDHYAGSYDRIDILVYKRLVPGFVFKPRML